MKNITKAVMLTGAAARISQEVAIFDQLQNVQNLTISEDDTFLVGFSSGSLNLSALNACFRKEAPLNWKNYYQKEVLFTLENKDVLKKNEEALIPLKDTSPLRDTLHQFLKNTSMNIVQDLPFRSYVLTMHHHSGLELHHKNKTLWADSRNPEQEYILLSDLLMSSTAIPVVFPSQEIHSKQGFSSDFPTRKYYDGGTLGTFDDFEDYIGKLMREKGEPLEELYIISPMRESSEINIFTDNDLWEKLEEWAKKELQGFLEKVSMGTFVKFLKALDNWNKAYFPMAKKIFVCIPEMKKNFPILDFNHEEDQYNTVRKWLQDNPKKLAIPLEQFIEEHKDFLK